MSVCRRSPARERARAAGADPDGGLGRRGLLEDSSRAIEDYLCTRGYRDAMVVYTRQRAERASWSSRSKINRGPRYIVRNVSLTGNAAVPATELLPLLRLKEGEPFVRSTVVDRRRGDRTAVSGARIHARAGQVGRKRSRRPRTLPLRIGDDRRADRDRRRAANADRLGDVSRATRRSTSRRCAAWRCCRRAQAVLGSEIAGRSRADRSRVSQSRLRGCRGDVGSDVRSRTTRGPTSCSRSPRARR